jgi:uncharacterized repeat protein (TIGR01451 family)
LLVAIVLLITLGACGSPSYTAYPLSSTTLSLRLLNDPYLLVDSNNPASGPQVTVAYATVTNTGAATAYNVYMYIGDGTTPGTFAPGSDGQTLSMLGSIADATRFIVNLAPGESRTVYWMLKYPLTDAKTYPMTIWARSADGSFVQGSHTYTTQSTISASADKMLGTVTLDPADGQVHVGNVLTVTVTGFNFGTIGSSGDAWLQPVGNPEFNPDQFRLIKAEVYIHSIAGKCGYGSMPVYDQLYFPGIRTCYSFNAADYVKYYFVATSEGTTTAKVYQKAASGSQEKYSTDYGTAGATVTLTDHCGGIMLWKSVDPQTATANTVLVWTITYRNDTDLPIGAPGSGNGLTVREDAIPANTTYVPGSATCSGSCIVYYSTDNGVTWTTTEPAPGQLTRIRWFINQAIPAHSMGWVSFRSRVNSGVTGYPPIGNSASAGVGDCPFEPTDTVYANGGVDLDLTKVTSNHHPCEGSVFTYAVTVYNPSATNASGVQVTDLLPPGLTYVSNSTTQGTYSSGTGLWNVGTLNAYSSATLTITVGVNAGTAGTTIINWGEITHSDQWDPVTSNNRDHDGIAVNAAPAAYPASNSPVCEGDTIYLFGGPGGMTSYHWEGPGGFTSYQENAVIPNATSAMAGAYTLTITDSNGCGSASATINIIVDAVPTATASSNSPVCEGGTIQLSGGPSGAYNYSWTGPGGWTSSSQSDTRTGATTAMTGTYTLTVTNSNGCSDDASTSVTVNAKPTASAGDDESFCAGSSVRIGGSPTGSGGTGPYTYSWTPATGLDNVASANPFASVAGTYTVRVTDANGCWDEESVMVTQNPTPTADAGADQTIGCGESKTIGSSPTVGYTYSWTPTTGLSDPTISNPTASAGGNYTVRVTDANGCWAEDSVVVTVSGAPIADAGPDREICPGGSPVQIGSSPTGGCTYSWTPPTGLSNPAIANPYAVPTSTTTYSVLVTDGSCQATDSVTVTVHAIPNCHTSATPSAIVCQGTTVILIEDGGDAVSWSWSTGASTQSIQVTSSGTYSVTITDSYGCQSSCQMSVTVYDGPTANAGDDKSFCTGGSAQIGGSQTGSGGTGTLSFSWTPATGLDDPTSPSPAALAAGNYTVRVTDANGCWDEDSVVVTQNPTPTAYAGPDKSFCPGNSVQIGGSPTGSGGTGDLDYSWTPAGGLNSATIPNPTASSAGTYTVTVTDDEGCRAEDSVAVTERVASAASSSPVSQGASIYLAGGPDGMSSYSWTGPDGWTSTLQNPIRHGATTAMSGTYTLTITSSDGCTSVASIGVTLSGSGPGYGPVGWETRPVNKLRVLLPWIVLFAAIVAGTSLLVVRRRRV